MKLFEAITGFEWDKGNSDKNLAKHGVTNGESEEVFFNEPLVVRGDASHSKDEQRYYALGRTDTDRLLFIVFAIREDLIRIISARDMTKKESGVYRDRLKKTS